MLYVVIALIGLQLLLTYAAARVEKDLRTTLARHERMLTQAGIKFGEHAKQLAALDKVAPVNLAAEVVSLSEQVSRLRATHQRFQGRFDKYVALEADEPRDDDLESDDPKWLALMRLQQGIGNGTPGGS